MFRSENAVGLLLCFALFYGCEQSKSIENEPAKDVHNRDKTRPSDIKEATGHHTFEKDIYYLDPLPETEALQTMFMRQAADQQQRVLNENAILVDVDYPFVFTNKAGQRRFTLIDRQTILLHGLDADDGETRWYVHINDNGSMHVQAPNGLTRSWYPTLTALHDMAMLDRYLRLQIDENRLWYEIRQQKLALRSHPFMSSAEHGGVTEKEMRMLMRYKTIYTTTQPTTKVAE